jgi:hypothetical protein
MPATFDPYRAHSLRAVPTPFDSTQIPGEIRSCAVRATVPESGLHQALLTGWFGAIDYAKSEPEDAARRMGIRHRRRGAVPRGPKGIQTPSREENLRMLGGATPDEVTDADHGPDVTRSCAAE